MQKSALLFRGGLRVSCLNSRFKVGGVFEQGGEFSGLTLNEVVAECFG